MRNSIAFVLLILIAATFVPAQTANLSPAEASIDEARKAIAAKPERAEAYNALALALLRRARETSDASYIQQAEKAAKRSLQLAPDNFESQRTQVSVLLEKHEYPKALDQAKALNRKIADDIMVYGLLTHANAELGNYDEAEKAAQWMLNLRPGNSPALINTAYLRELFGDPDGAYEVLDLALQSTAPNETEESAWLLTRMARMRLISGNADAADNLLHRALVAFPGYHAALQGLAEVRVAQRRDDDAITLLKQCEQALPRAVALYHLAETLQVAGRADEAKKAFTEFQERAEAESSSKDNANRELIFYYADQAHQPTQALQLAKQELAWRHDVYTLDAYAWALHVNGQDLEARNQIETALAVGIRDAKLFRHAGEIALKLRDLATAERDLKQSVEMNTADSEQARLTLASLSEGGRR
jgi:tetratricopeptide (TPR) repeat protein